MIIELPISINYNYIKTPYLDFLKQELKLVSGS